MSEAGERIIERGRQDDTPQPTATADASQLYGGILVLAIGLAGLAASWPLARGTSFRMGPGYLPALLSWLIIAGGAGLILPALIKRSWSMPQAPLRGVLMVSLSLAFFGFAIETLGIVVASAGLVLIAGAAAAAPRWGEIALLAAGLGVGCALLFVKGLGLVIKIVPW
jgi:Tripartite tricarboxylate transporter TctB family